MYWVLVHSTAIFQNKSLRKSLNGQVPPVVTITFTYPMDPPYSRFKQWAMKMSGLSSKARRKARRQNNYLENKIYRALGNLGQTDKEIARRMLNSRRLDTDSVYQGILAQVHDLWQKDESFKQGCINTAHWVLLNQRRQQKIRSKASLELAARYFLAELPLFLRSPEIINSPSAVFCYHQCPEFVRTLYEQGAYGLLHDSQGFIIRAPKSGPFKATTSDSVDIAML